MHQQGILKTDDLITRFFRLCTEMCVEISYRAQAEQQHNPAANPTMIRAKCYHNLDAFVRLIALLVKHSGEATNTVTKINLLNKVWNPFLTCRFLCSLTHCSVPLIPVSSVSSPPHSTSPPGIV